MHPLQAQRPKRTAPTAFVSAVEGQNASLLHVEDSRTGQKWLVDSGALLSIIPPTPEQKSRGPNGPPLQAANGTRIQCYGKTHRTITIGGRDFYFEFIVADVRHRILGADFLSEFYLAPNHRDSVLLDLNPQSPKDDSSPVEFHHPTTLPATLAKGVTSSPVNLVEQATNPYYQLLDSFTPILTPSFTLSEVKHGIKHHIPTTCSPIQSRARPLHPDRLAIAKEAIDK